MSDCLKLPTAKSNPAIHIAAITLFVVIACFFVPAFAQRPATVSSSAAAAFEVKIRPLLLASCVGCHNKDSAGGGLRLDMPIPADKAQELLKRVRAKPWWQAPNAAWFRADEG